MAATSSGSDYLVRSVQKALGILELFDERRPTLAVNEVVALTGMTRATGYRFCRTLLQLGYLESTDHGRYRPGPKALYLGHAALRSLALPDLALPYLQQLQSVTRETTNMAVRDGLEIVYVVRLKTQQIVNIQLYEGSRLPVYCTSMGKAMLACLPSGEVEEILAGVDFQTYTSKTLTTAEAVRADLEITAQRGYAVNDEELARGLRSAAAAVLNANNYPIASINVAVPARVTTDEIHTMLAPHVVAAAKRISELAALTQSTTQGQAGATPIEVA